MYARSEPADREPDTSARPPLVRELLLVVGLFVVYKLGRQAANGHVEAAYRNAGHVWDFERAAHLPGEGAVQGALLHSETLIRLANTYYATVHFPATLLFLAWLYWRRPRHYVWSRRILAVLTGAALALHLLFPLAPPRMLDAAGLVDTGQVYGPTVYGDTPATDSMANQFAAMPSLHFGWALMVAVGLIVATRSRWRWLWLLHPLVTLLVIVGTANHYWLDSIVVSALLAVALATLRLQRTEPVRGHLSWSSGAGGEPELARTALPVSRVPGPAASQAYASSSGGPAMNATLIAVALSLVSAAAYASAAVAQARLAGRTDPGTGVLRMLGRGAWWSAVGLNAGGALLHVAALKYGPLTLVQPLGALTLVAAVPLGARAAGRRVTGTEWRGAILTLLGLGALLLTAGGSAPHETLSLVEALAVGAATMAVVAGLSRPGARPGLRHAAASGITSGVASALTQTLTVAVTDHTGPLFSWRLVTVALLVSAFAMGGLLLSQTAYQGGLGAPLAVVTLANPVAAAAIGLALLGERLQGGTIALVPALLGSAAAVRGVVLLSRAQDGTTPSAYRAGIEAEPAPSVPSRVVIGSARTTDQLTLRPELGRTPVGGP